MPYKDPEKRRTTQKEYQKRYYANNSDYYKSKAKIQKKAIRLWFREYKKTLSCSKCPESHPACLDFHHIDPKDKKMILSKLYPSGVSKKTILKEVAKCIVLCANCHRKEHYKEMAQ
jgi:hypothetical protein